MKFDTITGGQGEPEQPKWHLIYSDPNEIAYATAEWGQVVRELRERQTLSIANGHAIMRLVDFRVLYGRALRHVAEHGPVLKPKERSNRAGVRNPHWITMRHADETLRHLESELGIAPLRRNRAGKVHKRTLAARASDAYIKPLEG